MLQLCRGPFKNPGQFERCAPNNRVTSGLMSLCKVVSKFLFLFKNYLYADIRIKDIMKKCIYSLTCTAVLIQKNTSTYDDPKYDDCQVSLLWMNRYLEWTKSVEHLWLVLFVMKYEH